MNAPIVIDCKCLGKKNISVNCDLNLKRHIRKFYANLHQNVIEKYVKCCYLKRIAVTYDMHHSGTILQNFSQEVVNSILTII